MSIVNREPPVEALERQATPSAPPVAQRIPARSAQVGGSLSIRRALPAAVRRMIGPWCFLDQFGPADVSEGSGLRVNPHPHIGLQTVTWLLEGEILHRDSLGSTQLIKPGALNLMTAGRGIAHSEESPEARSSCLLGAQLWVALPDHSRDIEPAFDHHPVLPELGHEGLRITVLAGEFGGQRSPARAYSPILGLDIGGRAQQLAVVPLNPEFEHGVLVLKGQAWVAGQVLAPGTLLYLGGERTELELQLDHDSRLLLLGGQAFSAPVLMWWNFVARTRTEILRACHDWNEGCAYFGRVEGYDGERLQAPLPPWEAD